MIDTLVTGAPAAAPAVPVAVPAAAAAPAVDTAAYQRQIDELKEQVAEGQRTAQYWADKAKAGTPKAAEPAEEEPDVLEAITTGGAKGFDKLASQRGFIRKDEVEALINQRANSLTKEQSLIAEFPDLKNKASEFFKATALNYGALVKDGMPQPLAMEQAARATELEFLKAGKIKLPGAAPTPEEKEATRLRRIAAQAGDEGGRRPAAQSEEDTELDADQLRVVRQMLVGQPGADGKPMNEAQAIDRYKARAKSGVAMRGAR